MNRDARGFQRNLVVGKESYAYVSTKALAESIVDLHKLPVSLLILLESAVRGGGGAQTLAAFSQYLNEKTSSAEVDFHPARVLMQDFTGVPAVVDLAAMRGACQKMNHDPELINPLTPVDLVIDHSVMVDYAGSVDALAKNVALEYARNRERYTFLKWGQTAFRNFRVVPPGTGICHQVNLEHLAQVVWTSQSPEGVLWAYPDTVVGTDSHTTMVNGLGVLGWGVGGIEAEAAMLGQPLPMQIPDVIGFELKGSLAEGMTATDLVLTITNVLRKRGVVGKFVEFFGEGLQHLSLADRATVANMAPEYGATCGFFPIDDETIAYLRLTGRTHERIALVEAYAKEQGLWNEPEQKRIYTDTLSLDMATVEPSLAGPKRPQDRIPLSQVPGSLLGQGLLSPSGLKDGDVVIAAITSCTNTSNPSVMMAAGLLAQNALKRGLAVKPWVKTSLAPGSQVVSDYLEKSGLQKELDNLGFQTVGYGCTTCIGNSGPLDEKISQAVKEYDLNVAAVLSGNRNFEARVHPLVKSNYLASPPLVVAYALVGSIKHDFSNQPIGVDKQGEKVFLRDIWPSNKEIRDAIAEFVTAKMFQERYAHVFDGDEIWKAIATPKTQTYAWDPSSTYIKEPPFFDAYSGKAQEVQDIKNAKVLAVFGDSITTDHISPAGNIGVKSPAGSYLIDRGISLEDFNSYGSRRGNHEVMIRGTFANTRLKNELLTEVFGGYTKISGKNDVVSIFDAAEFYAQEKTPLVVVAGKEYGTGSSRDWAAKGTQLLGVRAVIAESFERIHRSNLVGMGVLPLEFIGDSRASLRLTGLETITIEGLSGKNIMPRQTLSVHVDYPNGHRKTLSVLCRIDTEDEVQYIKFDGILPYVLKQLTVGKS